VPVRVREGSAACGPTPRSPASAQGNRSAATGNESPHPIDVETDKFMISRHITRKAKNDDYQRLARYIQAADHGDEKALMSWCAGCLAGDDYELAVHEVVDTQDLNTRSTKEKTYHLVVSFRPEDESKLTPEVLKEIEVDFAKALGFEEHQRHCGVHKNTNNLHLHVAYNMIHPEKFTRHEPYRDYQARDKVCRELEKRFGLFIDNGKSINDIKPKLTPVAATIEAHTGQQSFDGYIKERRSLIMESLEQASTWQQVHHIFAQYGVEIKPHGNGLVIAERMGKQAIKASSLDRSLSMANLVKRFGVYMPPQNKIIAENCDEQYNAKPLHCESNRGALYEEYQSNISSKKKQLENLKNREQIELDSIRIKWDRERQKISNDFFGTYKIKLLKKSRLYEAKERLLIKKQSNESQIKLRQEAPYASWTDFLRCKAKQGDETALDILRSKKQTFKSENNLDNRNGQNFEIKENWIDKRLEIAAEHNESRRQRGLVALSKFSELAELEGDKGVESRIFSGFESEIDANGVVIFKLKNGGTIRDTGKKIYFSQQEKTKEAALMYAKSRWGRNVRMLDNGFIQPSQEITREKQKNRGMER